MVLESYRGRLQPYLRRLSRPFLTWTPGQSQRPLPGSLRARGRSGGQRPVPRELGVPGLPSSGPSDLRVRGLRCGGWGGRAEYRAHIHPRRLLGPRVRPVRGSLRGPRHHDLRVRQPDHRPPGPGEPPAHELHGDPGPGRRGRTPLPRAPFPGRPSGRYWLSPRSSSSTSPYPGPGRRAPRSRTSASLGSDLLSSI